MSIFFIDIVVLSIIIVVVVDINIVLMRIVVVVFSKFIAVLCIIVNVGWVFKYKQVALTPGVAINREINCPSP